MRFNAEVHVRFDQRVDHRTAMAGSGMTNK